MKYFYRMKIYFHLGDVIRKAREATLSGKKPLTRDALAKRIRIRPNLMGDIEKTGKCSTDVLQRIATALGVSESFLFDQVPKQTTVNHSTSYCSEHQALLHRLDSILDQPNGERFVPVIEALLTSAARETGSGNSFYERQHGPGRPIDDLGPGIPLSEIKKKKKGA